MGINSVLVTKHNLVQIQFDLHHFKGTTEETRLLDTGATESFIDQKAVTHLKLGTQKLPIE
jgi:predicted aspartyl protease